MRGCRTPGLFRSWPGLGRGCHGWQVEHQLTQRLDCCFVHLLQPKLKAPNGHNGLASARTCALKRDGRSPGVLTSTCTPRSASSSTCSPPKSNSVVSGEGSTSKSRSLPSLSAPCRTEPNTRGLLTRNLRAASRMAWLFSWRAREGFIVFLAACPAVKCLTHQAANISELPYRQLRKSSRRRILRLVDFYLAVNRLILAVAPERLPSLGGGLQRSWLDCRASTYGISPQEGGYGCD